MTPQEVLTITNILIDVIERDITKDNRLFHNYGNHYPDIPAYIPGLCYLCNRVLPAYTQQEIHNYIMELYKYKSDSIISLYWFTKYDFRIRLNFLNHIKKCITDNTFTQFN
jgi:hypothetical protein